MELPATQVATLAAKIDAATRKRVGSLASGGLDDGQIATVLLLTEAEVAAVRATPEFKDTFAGEELRRVESQAERDAGWDAIEEEGMSKVLNSLKFNSDPNFALLAARTANQAKRHTRQTRIIDPASRGTVVMLQLNAQFVEKYIGQREAGVIDMSPRQTRNFERRASDMPSPKRVTEILSGGEVKDTLTIGLDKLGDLNDT